MYFCAGARACLSDPPTPLTTAAGHQRQGPRSCGRRGRQHGLRFKTTVAGVGIAGVGMAPIIMDTNNGNNDNMDKNNSALITLKKITARNENK